MIKKFIIPAVALIMVMGGNCAYYSTTSSYLPAHIKTIAIPSFGNESYEQGVSEDLTEMVIDRFMANSRLKVVNRRTANSVLEAVITLVEDEPFTIGEGEIAQQYKLIIRLRAVYRDITSGEIIWENDTMEGWETYDLSSGAANDRDQALDKAIERLATDIVNQTLAGW